MKELNVRISGKVVVIVLAVVIVGMAGALANLYKDHMNTKKDLYGLRDDYYCTKCDYSAEEANPKNEGYSAEFSHEIINQSVQALRVPVVQEKYSEETQYETKSIRVLEVAIENKANYLISYGDNLARIDQNGVVRRGISVHPDDNQNPDDSTYVELTPGGKTTIYLYYVDDGEEIDKLLDTYGMGV